MSTTHTEGYSIDISQRFHNELRVLGLLRKDISAVPFIGVYSTEIHPFGLVYEYMDGFDLRQQLRNKPDVGRMSLVPILSRTFLIPHNPLMLLDNS